MRPCCQSRLSPFCFHLYLARAPSIVCAHCMYCNIVLLLPVLRDFLAAMQLLAPHRSLLQAPPMIRSSTA